MYFISFIQRSIQSAIKIYFLSDNPVEHCQETCACKKRVRFDGPAPTAGHHKRGLLLNDKDLVGERYFKPFRLLNL